jgi:hypothetical protein
MGGSSTLGTERRSELKQFPILSFNYLSTTIKNVNCASLSETPLTHPHTQYKNEAEAPTPKQIE